ncbi:MAG: O-antigen ligase family protein [Devosia sp.]|nr:O-antigen ligase family protein [Devosia sp.]
MPSEPAIAVPGTTSASLFERVLLGTVLTVILVLSCLLGFATTYLMAVLAVIAAGNFLYRRREVAWASGAPSKVFLAAFVILALLFAATARQPADVLLAFNFTAFLLYVPLATLFARGAGPGNARRIAWLALAGAAVGCTASAVEVYLLGTGRAGVVISDPIRLADTAVILGFLALMGLTQQKDPLRWVFLLGPAVALITVSLTGARIAMLAYPVLVLAAMLLLMRRKWLGLLLGALFVGLLLLAAFSGLFGGERLASLLSVVNDILSGNPVADEATRIRLELYKAGWAAFQQSPLIGHGWAQLMSTPATFLAETDQVHASLPHLHNELLNFAVAGGLTGVAVYLALIVLPVAVALRSPRDSQYPARLVGSVILVTAYLVMGLTDTMLSFELHTALYVGLTAILLGYCRDGSRA